jgi:amino-acid N-acetyltransferase
VTFQPLAPDSRSEIEALLQSSHLPTSDLDAAHPFFIGERDDTGLAGVVGVERRGSVGLLRSLAVRPDRQGTGLGTRLADAAEQWALGQGIDQLYLLTTTAERFFARRGYEVQSRDQVDPAIRTTTEFTSACPASAIVMRRVLAS